MWWFRLVLSGNGYYNSCGSGFFFFFGIIDVRCFVLFFVFCGCGLILMSCGGLQYCGLILVDMIMATSGRWVDFGFWLR